MNKRVQVVVYEESDDIEVKKYNVKWNMSARKV